ncbi:sigma-70 family RNA polymerase sigma factor [Bacillus cihuensis]|uniref:sigma-70 family RNA polymerase sigma factor n=1 Tax=Bacillus cihuensis TaxID=1208599 RepID=UPI0004211D42|nr:sigma-70 family RNA polymerase sigma factor [Bacillus cihuensis]
MKQMTSTYLPNSYDRLFQRHPDFFEQPIMKYFLQSQEHVSIFHATLKNPTSQNMNDLNETFQLFYHRVKVYKYLISFIHTFSIDFDKRERRRKRKYLTILDKPAEHGAHTNMIDTLAYMEEEFVTVFHTEQLSSILTEEKLVKAIAKLTEKQRQVLSLMYCSGLSNKEIATYFHETPQNISNIHKQALKKLRKS